MFGGSCFSVGPVPPAPCVESLSFRHQAAAAASAGHQRGVFGWISPLLQGEARCVFHQNRSGPRRLRVRPVPVSPSTCPPPTAQPKQPPGHSQKPRQASPQGLPPGGEYRRLTCKASEPGLTCAGTFRPFHLLPTSPLLPGGGTEAQEMFKWLPHRSYF